jgi:hypothetical protein
MSSDWDYNREILKGAGFGSVFGAEQMAASPGYGEYPRSFGYFDEGKPLSRYLLICRQS